MLLRAASMAGLPLCYQLLVLLLLIPLAFIVRLARIRRSGHHHRLLPPGPWALPVIGNLHHLLAGALPPHHRLRDLSRRHGPLMLLRLGELRVVVASSAAAAREIMKANDLAFCTRTVGPATRQVLVEGSEGLIFAPYGDAWRQLRKVCTLELLSARRVQSFRAVREQEVARLLSAVAAPAAAPAEAGAVVNLSRQISSYVADSMARAIMGSRFKDREAFFRLLQQGLKLFSAPSLPDLYPSSRLAMLLSPTPRRMRRLRAETMAFMEAIILEHRQKMTKADHHQDAAAEEEDLIDVLLRIQRDGDLQFSLTTETIKAVAANMFLAGGETSSTTLEWAMAELMRNPRAMHKAQDEVRRVLDGGQPRVTESSLGKLHYLRLILKETLRLHPPLPLLLPRECRRPCQVLGFDVPAGATVLVNAWAIGRDPAHWDDAPEDFAPERFEFEHSGAGVDFKGTDFEYLPFGAGRRMCPGMAFGLANMELACSC